MPSGLAERVDRRRAPRARRRLIAGLARLPLGQSHSSPRSSHDWPDAAWYNTYVQDWDLKSVEVEPHEPRILASAKDARTILIRLSAGEEMQEHEVHERARVVVVDGEIEVTLPGGGSVAAGAGHLFEFDPGERRTVAARSDARLLLVLSPWPGDGHPGALTLEQKAEARERAAERQS
jgi:quercetin dioxygenase-like cupin family protein